MARQSLFITVIPVLLSWLCGSALAWHDETHVAVAKAAGYRKWYNAVGADIAKIKAGPIERNNHHYNNTANAEVTPEMAIAQTARYNDPTDAEGHLYGAIVAAIREYRSTVQAGKYPEYHMAFCVHYIGDLSNPLHNTLYDEFNRLRHEANDGTVEDEVMDNISLIEAHMHPVKILPDRWEEDLAGEIARIANTAHELGKKLRAEGRNMTRAEAYKQLGQSASLLKALISALSNSGSAQPVTTVPDRTTPTCP